MSIRKQGEQSHKFIATLAGQLPPGTEEGSPALARGGGRKQLKLGDLFSDGHLKC